MSEFDVKFESSNSQVKKVCPHLGIQFDPKSYYAYPSSLHRCYFTHPVGSPVETHQVKTCLTPMYDKCPVFNQAQGLKMPSELSSEQKTIWQTKKFIVPAAGLVLTSLIIFMIFNLNRKIASLDQAQPLTSTIAQSTQQATQTASPGFEYIGVIDNNTSTSTVNPKLPTATATLVPTPTITHTPTITLTPTSALGLDIIIGEVYKFVIHRTATGESVQMYADLYNTTPQAIYDSNYLMPVPIWINWLIIIPVDMADTSELPAFEAYMVENNGIRLDLLADELDVKLKELMLYNNLEVDQILNNGDWLLIPRERPEFTN